MAEQEGGALHSRARFLKRNDSGWHSECHLAGGLERQAHFGLHVTGGGFKDLLHVLATVEKALTIYMKGSKPPGRLADATNQTTQLQVCWRGTH